MFPGIFFSLSSTSKVNFRRFSSICLLFVVEQNTLTVAPKPKQFYFADKHPQKNP